MNNHYFIGKLLNPNDARKLNSSQNFIIKSLNNMDVAVTGKVTDFHTKFAYIGYMDENTELMLKDKLSNMFEAIANNVAPQTGTYTDYQITGSKTRKSVALAYENDVIYKLIPYIRSYTDAIFEYPTETFIPHVSLVRFDSRDLAKVQRTDSRGKTLLDRVYMPNPNTFDIDSIDLLRGTPKITRTGAPSKYDDMDVKVVAKYSLRGSGTNNKPNNKPNNNKSNNKPNNKKNNSLNLF